MTQGRVFLSAVSSEFGRERRELRHDFGTHGMQVAVQEELSHLTGAGTLLHLLDTHMRDCTGAVFVIGDRSGAGFPTDVEADAFPGLLPAEMLRASYTQWEFFLARKHGTKLIVCRSRPGHTPNVPDEELAEPDDVALQAVFVRQVELSGVPRMVFSGIDELGRIVMRQPWVAPVQDKLLLLPYPSLGTLFKGRDAFLRRLRASLTRPDGGAAAIAGRAVHGLGGVGKTRAAVEYAWAHRADYTALALLDAETGEKLHASLAALVGPLRLPERAAPDEAARMEAVLAWLNANPGWFLILDNVDAEPALGAANRLLGRLQGGHVVLTSRLTAGFARGVERLDLDVLSLDDAAAFLLEATEGGRRKAADDAAQARALAEELGQLALALEMAAATIEARGFGFAAYRTLWQGSRARVVGWADQKITGYHHAVAETWQTSVDQLTEAGRHLLERLAFLAPDPVPGFLLDVAVPGAETEDAAMGLDDLAAYSLVTRDVESGTFLVHRLVQDVTRRGLEVAGTTTARLNEALGWMHAAFTGNPMDVRTWGRLDPLAPHAEAVAGYGNDAAIPEPTAHTMDRVATLFQTKALYSRADPLFRRAVAIAEKHYGPNSSGVATYLNNLALLLSATNRLGEAEPLYHRALAIDEASLGKDHPTVATRLNNLAGLLRATNRLGAAEPLYRRALAIDEASLGKDHPTVATDLNNLALLLRATNRLGEAEPLYRRALAIGEASLGKDHPTVASYLNNLAGLLRGTNRLDEAEPLFRRALAISEASLGKDHPNVSIRLNNLAGLLQDTNRLGEAEPLYRRALAIDEASLGKDHPDVAIDLNNLAELLRATNRLGEAEPLMRRMVVIFLAFGRTTGHTHPHRDAAIGNYVGLLAAMGKNDAEIQVAIAALGSSA